MVHLPDKIVNLFLLDKVVTLRHNENYNFKLIFLDKVITLRRNEKL